MTPSALLLSSPLLPQDLLIKQQTEHAALAAVRAVKKA
jgi:hypothetical protein